MKMALIRVPRIVAMRAHVVIFIVRSVLIFLLETPMLLMVSMSEECCLTNRVTAEIAVALAKTSTTIDRMISVSLLIP